MIGDMDFTAAQNLCELINGNIIVHYYTSLTTYSTYAKLWLYINR